MFGQAESVTLDMVKLALDAASLRHMAIANNIANVNSKDYAPATVDFERQMDGIQATLAEGNEVTKDMLSGIQPVIRRLSPQREGQTAQLDMEVAALAQNTVQYEALLRALGKQMSLLDSAIKEGKS